MGLIVRGGTVVTPQGTAPGEVRVEGGRIAGVGADVGAGAGDEVVDAGGCYVLPGGVDPHCHVMADVAGASRAAALGGTTTLLSFTSPLGGEAPAAAVRRARKLVDGGGALVDVGLHAACYRPDELTAADVAEVAGLGADAVKIFLAYPELGIMASGGGLLRAMGHAARAGLPVQVHAEDGEIIEALVEWAAAGGRRDRAVFAEVRPPVTEELAAARALAVAALAGARCYLPHLSTEGALDAVRRARAAGVPVTAEVCTHHVLVGEDAYGAPGGEALLVAPPLRARRHVEAVGRAVADGTVDTIGSDHAQERTPVDARIAASPASSYGIAGVGARVPLLLGWGAEQGIPLGRLAQLLATGPAAAFGHPTKGALAAGADGDVVVWDPDARWTLGADSFPDGTGCAPYAGRPVTGRVRWVCARGRVVVRDGELVDGEPAGRFLPRGGPR